MRKLSHESLTVYQRSVSFVAWSSDLCRSKREIVGEIQNQYKVSVQALFAGIRSVGLTAVGLALERLS